jgi:hypothetical protein
MFEHRYLCLVGLVLVTAATSCQSSGDGQPMPSQKVDSLLRSSERTPLLD